MASVDAQDFFKALNWNIVEDEMDQRVWQRVNTNFWLPERISFSDDKPSWRTLNDDEQDTTMKVYVGLTLFDTLQSEIGVSHIKPHALTAHETHVLNQFEFMESVHTKNYSSIFMTLASVTAITNAFEWSYKNEPLQRKARLIAEAYKSGDAMKVRIASVFLESFVFYSGFYWPLYWMSRGKLTMTGSSIKLIIRDEAVHGFYIGYKFRRAAAALSAEKQAEYHDYAVDLLMKLYEAEVEYTELLYARSGMVEDVMAFVHLNANKAMQNLGYEGLFPDEICQVNPAILEGMNETSDIIHDFFSVVGPSYFMPKAEEATADDYAYSDDDPRLARFR